MTRRTFILIPALGLALVLANVAGVAQAGYVSSGLECVRGDATAIDLSLGAGAAPSESVAVADHIRFDRISQNLATLSKTPPAFAPPSGIAPPHCECSRRDP